MSDHEIPAPSSDDVVTRDLARFANLLEKHYGPRLSGAYLIGSRARGSAQNDSDADVAVVLADGFDFWSEVNALSDLGYDFLVDDGVDIQAHPISQAEWRNPERHANARFLRAAQRDAQPLRQRQ